MEYVDQTKKYYNYSIMYLIIIAISYLRFTSLMVFSVIRIINKGSILLCFPSFRANIL